MEVNMVARDDGSETWREYFRLLIEQRPRQFPPIDMADLAIDHLPRARKNEWGGYFKLPPPGPEASMVQRCGI